MSMAVGERENPKKEPTAASTVSIPRIQTLRSKDIADGYSIQAVGEKCDACFHRCSRSVMSASNDAQTVLTKSLGKKMSQSIEDQL
jgi:hypothetical protein